MTEDDIINPDNPQWTMKGPVRRAWILRLLSGGCLQASRFLHPKENYFDVLGVLTDIYIQEHGLAWAKGKRGLFNIGGIESVLPPFVAKWSGLPYEAANLLARMNDSGVSLPRLAAFIERNVGDDHESTPGISPQMGLVTQHSTTRTEPVERVLP